MMTLQFHFQVQRNSQVPRERFQWLLLTQEYVTGVLEILSSSPLLMPVPIQECSRLLITLYLQVPALEV